VIVTDATITPALNLGRHAHWLVFLCHDTHSATVLISIRTLPVCTCGVSGLSESRFSALALLKALLVRLLALALQSAAGVCGHC
jgi:hypothetical protein